MYTLFCMGAGQSLEKKIEHLVHEYTDSGNKKHFQKKLLSLITSIDRKDLNSVRTAVMLKKEEKILEGRTWEAVYKILEKWFEHNTEDEMALTIGKETDADLIKLQTDADLIKLRF